MQRGSAVCSRSHSQRLPPLGLSVSITTPNASGWTLPGARRDSAWGVLLLPSQPLKRQVQGPGLRGSVHSQVGLACCLEGRLCRSRAQCLLGTLGTCLLW